MTEKAEIESKIIEIKKLIDKAKYVDQRKLLLEHLTLLEQNKRDAEQKPVPPCSIYFWD